MITKILLASAMAGLALITAPEADADEQGYIRDLRNNGWTVGNPAPVIEVGHAICEQLNYNNGEQVAEILYTRTPSSITPTPDDARLWVLIAVAELCPWHYHGTSGSQVA